MADTIKIGSFEVSSFKVGNADCKIYLGNTLLYPHSAPHNYYNDYFTFEAIESGTFTFTGFSGNSLSYSLDSGTTWTALASGVASPTVSAGNKILWKGSNLLVGTTTADPGIGKFTATGNFNVEGNIKSLILGDNFTQDADLSSEDNKFLFSNLFDGCTKVISAENMKLPTAYLPKAPFRAMFINCTELTTAPSELPVMTMTLNCYLGMFQGCSKLTKAPDALPATTLAQGCYAQMFQGCSSLVTPISVLPALELEQYCYQDMYQGCSALTTAPVISATSLNNTATCTRMFKNCVSLTTAPVLRPTTLSANCYQYMFQGCTSLTTIPNNMLPATTLANYCYQYMFSGCTSLETVPSNMLQATTLANYCYIYMFQGCTKLTASPILPAPTLVSGCYQYMFNGCSKLSTITCLATTSITTTNCRNWVRGVASSGTFRKASSATWPLSNNGVPSTWTVVNYTS